MKKLLSFIIVLLLTIVFISNVKAKSSELEVTNVEILEKAGFKNISVSSVEKENYRLFKANK